MMRLFKSIALGLALLVSPVASYAAEGDLSAAEEARAREIGKSLRCVVCQNQAIEESNAPLAADMRQLVRERVAAGDSDTEIVDYLVDRYGTFVLMKPPLRGDTLFLWFGPLLIFLAACVAGVIYVRRGKSEAAPQPDDLSAEEITKLQNKLREEAAI
ncbi:MAG: cytochrome c-type biogenesis protein [Henriciella sp.]